MTPEQKFSHSVRGLLAGVLCRVTQQLDAGVPGPADLLVEWPNQWHWLELKVGTQPRSEQIDFLHDRWSFNQNSWLLKAYPSSYVLWRGCDVSKPLDKTTSLWLGSRLTGALLHHCLSTNTAPPVNTCVRGAAVV